MALQSLHRNFNSPGAVYLDRCGRGGSCRADAAWVVPQISSSPSSCLDNRSLRMMWLVSSFGVYGIYDIASLLVDIRSQRMHVSERLQA